VAAMAVMAVAKGPAAYPEVPAAEATAEAATAAARVVAVRVAEKEAV